MLNNIENDLKKESQSTVEAGAASEGIRWVVKKIIMSIKFEHAKPNPKLNKTFRQETGRSLMKECDEKSKAKIKTFKRINVRDNVEPIGPYTPVLNQCEKDKNIQTLIRRIDAKKMNLGRRKTNTQKLGIGSMSILEFFL